MGASPMRLRLEPRMPGRGAHATFRDRTLSSIRTKRPSSPHKSRPDLADAVVVELSTPAQPASSAQPVRRPPPARASLIRHAPWMLIVLATVLAFNRLIRCDFVRY